MSLCSFDGKAGAVAALIIAAIAAIEVPQREGADIMAVLLELLHRQDKISPAVSILTAMGYIYEQVDPTLLSTKLDDVLSVVTPTLAKRGPKSSEIQASAMNLLYILLPFMQKNFEEEKQRDCIMEIIHNSACDPHVGTQVKAFECMARCVTMYYGKMRVYLEGAFLKMSAVGMQSNVEDVALRAIEFWTSVAEEEVQLEEDYQDMLAGLVEDVIEQPGYYCMAASSTIVPVLLLLLARQEEDADAEEWTISKAAGVCLSFFALATKDAIAPGVIDFVSGHIHDRDWRFREAAITALGSIIAGPAPSTLMKSVNAALPILFDLMGDPHAGVRETTSWVLGRICQNLPTYLDPADHIPKLVAVLTRGLHAEERITNNCCWALKDLVDGISASHERPEGMVGNTISISPFIFDVVSTLNALTATALHQSDYRTAAYEAISAFVNAATPEEHTQVLAGVTLMALERMEALLSSDNRPSDTDGYNNWEDLQANLCTVLAAIIRKVGPGMADLAERIMKDITDLITSADSASVVLEDAFIVAGSLAAAIGTKFQPHAETFLRLLYPALVAQQDARLCEIAVGVIGDICSALKRQIKPYVDAIVEVLLANLKNEKLAYGAKPINLACLGDVAMAAEGDFAPHIGPVMTVLCEAATAQPESFSPDVIEALREAILEAHMGVIVGCKLNPASDTLRPHVGTILDACRTVLLDKSSSEDLDKLAYGVIGELADCFQDGSIASVLNEQQWLRDAFETTVVYSKDTRYAIRWAKGATRRAVAQDVVSSNSA
ncbi:unnamed protein product [Peniophora sp. CBMAI 1063]|nr:unnamed protein product [Peniophora sp. CBMAI 1063]